MDCAFRLMPAAAAAALVLAAAPPALAQLSGSGTMTSTDTGDGYHWNILTIHNTGTTRIGSLRFGWKPGQLLLPHQPVFVLGPPGWFGSVVNGPGRYSVEWFAWDPDAEILPGQSLEGFEFVGPDTPAVLTGPSPVAPGSFCNDSYMWINEVGGDPGFLFRVGIGTPPPTCGTADFNGDGDVGTDQDIEAFFACLGGSCCAACFPGGSDFNGDGDVGTDQDIESFFRVLGGGPC